MLSAKPYDTMRWLIPRLPRFAGAHPDVTLHLMAAGAVGFGPPPRVDLALTPLATSASYGLRAEIAGEEWVGVVCRAGSAARAPAA
ncbi:hypothetical protein ACU4GD_29980 [Cupriavidus basilensis]